MTEAAASINPGDHVENMVQLVTSIARSLVDAPEAILVEAVEEGDGVLLRLRLAADDVGKVIGRQGRTARSLRTILGAASMKAKQRYSLDIVEQR